MSSFFSTHLPTSLVSIVAIPEAVPTKNIANAKRIANTWSKYVVKTCKQHCGGYKYDVNGDS